MTAKRTRSNGEGSIYPYRSGYAAYAWITTPTGRRQRKYVYGKTREDVHGKWIDLTTKARRGAVVAKVPTLQVYAARWLAEVVSPNLAPKTASNYDLFMRLYILPDLGRRRVDKLAVRDVQTWLNDLRTRCQCCAQGKDAVRRLPRCCAAGSCCRQVASEWTRHQAWNVLQGALSNAVRDELVVRNVAALVRVPLPRPIRDRVWSVDESRQFLEHSRAVKDPLHAAYVLMLTLGLRRGEVLGLAWEDVDFAGAQGVFRWQLQRVSGRGLVRRETKTRASEATLPLPGLCVEALRARRAEQEGAAATAGEVWHDSGLVFTTPLGMPIDPRNFHRAFTGRAAAAGVPVTKVHATRKACASFLVALEVHPRVVMQILRHSQIAVTMDVYSQVTSTSTTEALRRLGEQLGAQGA